ncbi:hypothetical protein B7494_g4783 [Chlorociboria aeruginascens]|nr:hypothetical protein B7494_g4783 [Chlorociboria aeruginascens]
MSTTAQIFTELKGVVKQREANKAQAAQSASKSTEISSLTGPPSVVVFTDLGKDLDDLLALLVLKEYHRLGIIELVAIITNLHPEEKRAWFAEGAAKSLGLNVWIGQGTKGSKEVHETEYYEFNPQYATFISPDGWRHSESGPEKLRIYAGFSLFETILRGAQAGRQKITLLLLSSLTDIAQFMQQPGNEDLFKNTVSEVVMQGGYEVGADGTINPAIDLTYGAMNNKFDPEAAIYFHASLQRRAIESTVYTKAAAFAAPVSSEFIKRLANTGHSVGRYLNSVKIEQDVVFYVNSCSPTPRYMSRENFLKFKTTLPKSQWENAPIGRNIVPYLGGALAYDALAALHVGGADVRGILGYIDQASILRQTNCYKSPIHRVIGFQPLGPWDKRPRMSHLHESVVSNVLSALFMGALQTTLDDDQRNVQSLETRVHNAVKMRGPDIKKEMQRIQENAVRYENMRLNSKGKRSS